MEQNKIKLLTKAEEQIMQILWMLKRAVVNDILDQIPKPRPAYNTASTITRILVKKGFVGFKAYGKTHEYYPLIEKDEYRNFYLKNFLTGYFGGSFQNLVSFFAKENDIDPAKLEKMIQKVEEEIKSNNLE